jgi:hypothetical protein
VKSPTGSPLTRIVIAVALSILVHSLLLWQLPKINLAANEELSPQLQAKLEPLPRLARQPVARKPKVRRSAHPKPKAEPAAAPSPSIAATTGPAASSVPAEPVAAETDSPVPALTPAEEPVSHPLLPKHAQLHFAVQYGSGTIKVGEVSHMLDNIDGHYTLRAVTQTTGLVSVFKNYRLTQTSTGTLSKQGLRPDSYIEVKTDSSKAQTSSASFDWDTKKIHFSSGTESPLPAQAQDALSLPYQLSQLPMNLDSFPIALSNGKSINQYYIAVGDEGTINTAMGELRTIELHKVHGANEEGLIIWLALEYRLLPVKMLYLDKSGEVSANMVITDIRVSDE